MATNPITSTLSDEQKAVAGKALQDTLVDLIDLTLMPSRRTGTSSASSSAPCTSTSTSS